MSAAPNNINAGNNVPNNSVVKVLMWQGEPWRGLQTPGHGNTVLLLTRKI